jgi:serine/threonine protein phosphatase 1
MTYVIADIHGEYFKFIKMLEIIEFKDIDRMFILGDVIDRGKYPTRTLLYIIDHPNMIMIMGNHEYMMLGSMQKQSRLHSCWMNNGGEITLNQFQGLNIGNQNKIVKYIYDLPNVIELDNYILVHAGLNKTHENDYDFSIWAREEFLDYSTELDKTVIFGHTPTCFMSTKTPMSIWYDDGRIGIDCGACFKGGRLGCLRLDDMKEFYV